MCTSAVSVAVMSASLILQALTHSASWILRLWMQGQWLTLSCILKDLIDTFFGAKLKCIHG